MEKIMVVSDLDRTLTHPDDNFVIRKDVVEAVNSFARKHLFEVVTGRERKYIPILAEGLQPSGWVLENGSILLINNTLIKLVGEEWFIEREKIRGQLTQDGVPYSAGEVILYVDNISNYFNQLSKLYEMGLKFSIEINKGDGMILPPNINKRTGVESIKRKLSFKGITIAVGDGENDEKLFEAADVRVAVKNATHRLKSMADIVLTREDGEGILELIDIIETGKLFDLIPKEKR